MSNKIILVTGASSGFGALAARALAEAGDTVYATMRETQGRNAPQMEAVRAWARETERDLRPLELDVQSQASNEAAVEAVMAESGRIDVIVHNAGHMVFGPAEAFTPEQYAAQYDVNVLGAQRLNRAALPHMRARRDGLLVWVGSASTTGGTPPWLGPYFAAKAAMDRLAVVYAGELTRWGIETSIIVPGAYTTGTNHFLHAGSPGDQPTADAYAKGPYAEIEEDISTGLAALEPEDADAADVGRAIAGVVAAPRGRRPFRVHVNAAPEGADVADPVVDRLRAELLRRAGLGDLLTVRAPAANKGRS